jgi:L-seryl-tRNA(Ser) seleniumtransferase
MDALLSDPRGVALCDRHGRSASKSALSAALDQLRSVWRGGGSLPSPDAVFAAAEADLSARFGPPLRRVVNATGVVLHTNLGRAPLPASVLRDSVGALSCYVDLEMDLSAGERGQRDRYVEASFADLFGPGYQAVVVNNNAAALLLLLKALSAGRETVVSRGELVEIGGGFRVPEVMAASGAHLREVGTTNRTRPEDYERAVGPETALLLKIHPSNYRVVGFTQEVSVAELVAVGRRTGVPTAYDLGSGLLLPAGTLPLGDEGGAGDALASGVDALCFSADKLLGGCQAGVLLLRPALCERVRGEPLLRVLRADKWTYFILGAILDLYRRGRWREIPALCMLAASPADLRRRAQSLARAIAAAAPGAFSVEVIESEGRVGGGAAPLHPLSSPAVAISPSHGGASKLEAFLREGDPPTLAVVGGGRLLLHIRTLLPGDREAVVDRLAAWPETGG